MYVICYDFHYANKPRYYNPQRRAGRKTASNVECTCYNIKENGYATQRTSIMLMMMRWLINEWRLFRSSERSDVKLGMVVSVISSLPHIALF